MAWRWRLINKCIGFLGYEMHLFWSGNRWLIPVTLLDNGRSNRFGHYRYRVIVVRKVNNVFKRKRGALDPYQGGFSMFAPRKTKL